MDKLGEYRYLSRNRDETDLPKRGIFEVVKFCCVLEPACDKSIYLPKLLCVTETRDRQGNEIDVRQARPRKRKD